MDEHQRGHLEALWREEKRLEAAWGLAVWHKDLTAAARIRAEYMLVVDELQRLVKLPERRRAYETEWGKWQRLHRNSGG
jgi:hypothetical protein